MRRLTFLLIVWFIAIGGGSASAQISWQSGVNRNITPATQQALQRMQEIYGGPVTVSSGYRDPGRNANAGGASGSQHIHGTAVDISTRGLTPEQKGRLVAAATQAGFRGVGFYGENGHIHFDTRQNWATWGQRPRGVDQAMAQHFGNSSNRPVDASQNRLPGSTQQNQTQPSTSQPGTSQPSTPTSGSDGASGNPNAFPWISQVFTGSGNVNRPQDMGPQGTMTGIGDPTVCWVCDMAVTTMGVVESMIKAAADKFSMSLLGLLTVFVMITVCWMALRALVHGVSLWQTKLLPTLGRFAIVAAIFGSSGLLTSLAFDLVVGPPIEAGSTIGSSLAESASQSFGYRPQDVTCTADQASSKGMSQLVSSADALSKLACRVHVSATVGILLGGLLATHPTKDSSWSDKAVAILFFGLGLFLMYTAFMALLNFGFALVESLLISVIIAMFLPILLAIAVFESTKDALRIIWQNMLFVFINLIFTGMMAVTIVFVLMLSFSLGLGQSGAATDVQAVVSGVVRLMTTNDLSSAQNMATVIRFVAFAVAGSLVAARLMTATQILAAEVTGYSLGQVGALGNAGQAAAGRLFGTAAVIGGTGVMAAGMAGGTAAGMAVRGASALRGLIRGGGTPGINPNVTVR